MKRKQYGMSVGETEQKERQRGGFCKETVDILLCNCEESNTDKVNKQTNNLNKFKIPLSFHFKIKIFARPTVKQ